MTQRRNQKQWKNLPEQQEVSGLSGAEFCRQHQIDIGQFYYHSAQRRKTTTSGNLSSAFLFAQIAPVTVGADISDQPIRLQHCRSELRIAPLDS